MRAPPEVPQSRRGRKGRASGRPRPAAAVPAPIRAPPPPGRAAAARGRGRSSRVPASSRARDAAGAGSAERATYFPPAAGARLRRPATAEATAAEAGPTPAHGRRARPRSALAPTSASRRASVRSGRGADNSLPAAESPHPALIIIPNRRPSAGRGWGPTCACAGRASL